MKITPNHVDGVNRLIKHLERLYPVLEKLTIDSRNESIRRLLPTIKDYIRNINNLSRLTGNISSYEEAVRSILLMKANLNRLILVIGNISNEIGSFHTKHNVEIWSTIVTMYYILTDVDKRVSSILTELHKNLVTYINPDTYSECK